jgi:hypothetical protein
MKKNLEKEVFDKILAFVEIPRAEAELFVLSIVVSDRACFTN